MILNSQKLIDPMYEPKVYEEDGHLAISVKIIGEEIVFFELKRD